MTTSLGATSPQTAIEPSSGAPKAARSRPPKATPASALRFTQVQLGVLADLYVSALDHLEPPPVDIRFERDRLKTYDAEVTDFGGRAHAFRSSASRKLDASGRSECARASAIRSGVAGF